MSEEQQIGTPTGHSITHEEFVALEIARLRTDRLKARLWDLERFAENVVGQMQQLQSVPEQPQPQPQLEQLQKQFIEAKGSHDAITQELNTATQDLNDKVVELLEPLGLSNQRVLIDENEPHDIRTL